jgi:hypothetical protein
LIGLLIVLATVAYERYAQPWLTRRFAPRAAAPGNESLHPASHSG